MHMYHSTSLETLRIDAYRKHPEKTNTMTRNLVAEEDIDTTWLAFYRISYSAI